jgi:hypothetical protein
MNPRHKKRQKQQQKQRQKQKRHEGKSKNKNLDNSSRLIEAGLETGATQGAPALPVCS